MSTREKKHNSIPSVEPTITMIREEIIEGFFELQRSMAESDHASFDRHLELCQLDNLTLHLELCPPGYRAKFTRRQ